MGYIEYDEEKKTAKIFDGFGHKKIEAVLNPRNGFWELLSLTPIGERDRILRALDAHSTTY